MLILIIYQSISVSLTIGIIKIFYVQYLQNKKQDE